MTVLHYCHEQKEKPKGEHFEKLNLPKKINLQHNKPDKHKENNNCGNKDDKIGFCVLNKQRIFALEIDELIICVGLIRRNIEGLFKPIFNSLKWEHFPYTFFDSIRKSYAFVEETFVWRRMQIVHIEVYKSEES